MKTKPFKDAYIKKMLGYVTAEQMSFSRMVEVLNEEAKTYALSMCKETQRRCADRAAVRCVKGDRNESHNKAFPHTDGWEIFADKQSILSEDNIPKEVKS